MKQASHIHKLVVLPVIILLIWCGSVWASELIDKLKSPNWRERVKAVRTLGKDKSVDSAIRTNAIITALRVELKNPTPTTMEDSGWIFKYSMRNSISEHVQTQYLFALKDVDKPALLKSILEVEKEEALKKRIVVVLGMLKETKPITVIISGKLKEASVLEQLINLLLDDQDDFIRALAAQSLGYLGDERAIPALKQALNDPSARPIQSDVVIPGWNEIYPVRLEAACALRRLGVTVKSVDFNVWEVVE